MKLKFDFCGGRSYICSENDLEDAVKKMIY